MESLDQRLASEGAYLQLADNLEDFLGRLSDAATQASTRERQQILRLVIRDVLIDTDSVVIRHTIPNLGPGGDHSCHLRGSRAGRHDQREPSSTAWA